jgi:ferrous iron transport protein A
MSTTLADLRPGEAGVVEGFAQIDEGAQRLMQMGVVEGMEVEIVRYAPAGDPIEVRVLGYALSLRGKEAANVLVNRTA